MPNRLSEVPAMASARMRMPAKRYARARQALRHTADPLRMALQGLRGLDVIIEEQVWLCVDRTLDDLPVIAWLEFEPEPGRGLLDPVPCRVQFYHFHAQAIMDCVLERVDELLEARLADVLPKGHGEVCEFSPAQRSR